MGDGKDPDIIETDKPNEIITEADRARIARYHSYNTSALEREGVTRLFVYFHYKKHACVNQKFAIFDIV